MPLFHNVDIRYRFGISQTQIPKILTVICVLSQKRSSIDVATVLHPTGLFGKLVRHSEHWSTWCRKRVLTGDHGRTCTFRYGLIARISFMTENT